MGIDKIRKFRNVCIVDTPYALLQYLLMMGVEDIEQTLFCTGNRMDPDVVGRLPQVKSFWVGDNAWPHFIFRVLFRVRCEWFRFWTMRGARIYAQDHLYYSSQLIGRDCYTLIEDGPNVWRNNMERLARQESSWIERLGVALVYGPVFLKSFGRNGQCVKRWVSTDDDAEIYLRDGVRFERINIGSLWAQADSERRKFIIKVFGAEVFSAGFEKFVGRCESVLLTQPLMSDFDLTEAETFEAYHSAIEEYLGSGVVIKPHPRDDFDYEARFPKCRVLRTKVPMQLLCAMGLSFKRAITLFSSSVNEMPRDTELVWIGTAGITKIEKKILPGISAPSSFGTHRR